MWRDVSGVVFFGSTKRNIFLGNILWGMPFLSGGDAFFDPFSSYMVMFQNQFLVDSDPQFLGDHFHVFFVLICFW